MFMGGLGVAIAAEHSKLHERIALKVLLAVGADTKWLDIYALTRYISIFIFIEMFTSIFIC